MPAGRSAEQEALFRPRRDVSAADTTPGRRCCCCSTSPPLLPLPPVRPGGARERSIALCRKRRLRMRCGGLLQASLPSVSSAPPCPPGTSATAGEVWGRWLCSALFAAFALGWHPDVVPGRCVPLPPPPPPPPPRVVAVVVARTGFLPGQMRRRKEGNKEHATEKMTLSHGIKENGGPVCQPSAARAKLSRPR